MSASAVPAGAAEDGDGALGGGQAGFEGGEEGRGRGRAGRLGGGRGRRRRRDGAAQHVLGRGDHHRAGAALDGGGEGAGQHLVDAVGVVDLDRPFGHGSEDGGVVELLEASRPRWGRATWPTIRIIGAESPAVWTPVAAWGGARAAGDHADPRPAGQLAVRRGHVGGRRLVPAGDDVDAVALVPEGVENGEEALAGHAEHVGDAVGEEVLHEALGGGHWGAVQYGASLLPSRVS